MAGCRSCCDASLWLNHEENKGEKAVCVCVEGCACVCVWRGWIHLLKPTYSACSFSPSHRSLCGRLQSCQAWWHWKTKILILIVGSEMGDLATLQWVPVLECSSTNMLLAWVSPVSGCLAVVLNSFLSQVASISQTPPVSYSSFVLVKRKFFSVICALLQAIHVHSSYCAKQDNDHHKQVRLTFEDSVLCLLTVF